MGRKSNSEPLAPEIRKIRLSELEGFMASDFFRGLNPVPLTPGRAVSYLENPYGQADDVVLILAFAGRQLVAFRSLFGGAVKSGRGLTRFGWCSGSWVHPEFRRKGLATLLLKEAFDDWKGRLMLTNYSPETEKLFLKTGWFQPIHQYRGARGYLYLRRQTLMTLFRNKGVPAFFASLAAPLTGAGSKIILLFFAKKKMDFQFEEKERPDEQCFQLLRENSKRFLFCRQEKDWNWIFNFPWISETNKACRNHYPFTACSENFYYRTFKLWKGKELAGFFIFSVREGHLKTLFFLLNHHTGRQVAQFLRQYMAEHGLERITVYDREIAGHLLKKKLSFLFIKKYGQKIYSSFEVPHKDTLLFRDGEGDNVFT